MSACLSIIDGKGREQVLYKPEPLQAQFHASSLPNLLGWGPRGTGKSLMLRRDFEMRCLAVPEFPALIVRRTMPELRRSHLVFIDREMKELGGVFLHTTHTAKFANGSYITFGHCETQSDMLNFLGDQYGAIGFDERSTFSLEMEQQICSSARASTTAGYQAVVRATSNTLGIGSESMKQWYIDKDVDPIAYPEYQASEYGHIFLPFDSNPYLDRKAYAARLANLPDHIRRSWLLGEFVIEGAYFTDFRPTTTVPTEVEGEVEHRPWHVIPEMPRVGGVLLTDPAIGQVAPWLRIYRAVDWGFHPDPAVCLWFAVWPNGRTVVFKERTWRKTLARDVAQAIVRESEGMRVRETFADPTMDVETDYSIGDIFATNGVHLTFAVNDRHLYGQSINDYLMTVLTDGETRVPQVQLVRGKSGVGCPELIRTIPLMRMDPKAPQELADGNDHYVVALAYYCMGKSHPAQSASTTSTAIPRWMQPKRRGRGAYTEIYH